MIHLDTAQALIRWDEEDRIAVIEWRSYADGQEYRDVLNVLLDVMQKHAAAKLLADTRQMKVVAQEDQTWVTKEWGPKTIQAGLKWTAIVVPKSALAKLSLSRMVQTNPPGAGGNTVHFDSLDDARLWLRAVH